MTPKVRSALEYSGGRRFLLTVGAGIVSSALVWFGKITSSDYVLLIGATVATYIGSNTYQKKVATTKEEADK